MREYIISLFEWNWHDGGMRIAKLRKAKNPLEALLGEMGEYYEWLKSFKGDVCKAYIEEIKVYEFFSFSDKNSSSVYVIRGPVLELRGRITNENAIKVGKKEFLEEIKKKVTKYGKTGEEDRDLVLEALLLSGKI